MKKSLLFLFVLIFIAGCKPAPSQKDGKVLARVNNYEITIGEFNEEFGDSVYSRNGTDRAKRDFLNNLINRKLILQYAEAHGLDKGKSFLKMIERFWEQSLLKLAIDKKSTEISGSVSVSDREIEEAYNNLSPEARADKDYQQMYQQIKWELTRAKERQLMDDWITQLHKKAKIKTDYNLLDQ